ncbi:2-(1,2-epoxy-1,2-dihydrophenyl)acetyl-CoA isomerase [Streptomyces rubradiris]|uniref:2-(1,2-epoxy-1,2-dihydrophenyl)acetyl-CoA isomerase n=1 Tax=Streptomyces rubradiris TaxID=285531 RepID=A0ABQ3RMM8_STRRR|nr:enoyl-CoA hydratase-related protein [Streptomyces rubradiris]GHI57110.1 2-(1,2-epoxy-1,2-dihydrophenyl)acetyl-CoA isomerase [Streptomyces rubradiris]
MTGDVRHEVCDGVSYLTLDRPEALNALTPDMRERLIGLLARASADPAVRAVVLTGTGRGFCAGADLRGGAGAGGRATGGSTPVPGDGARTAEDSTPVPGDGAQGAGAAAPGDGARVVGDVARVLRLGAQRLIAAVLDCEKPVLAAVNGTAAGLGAHLALACDLVLAAESARFIEVFVRRGLVPDGGGAYLLPRLAGPHRAKELMFFGDAVDAGRAERLGLVNLVVPDAELAATARAWAARLASGPTRALALTKQLVNASLDDGRAAAFAAESWAQEINMTTRDAREGLRAFTERRAPHFDGR